MWCPVRILLVSVALASVAACASTAEAPRKAGPQVPGAAARDAGSPTVVPRASFERAIADGPGGLVRRLRLRSVLEEGRFVGFRVVAMTADLARACSHRIRPGDVVRSVNRRPIGRPGQFMDLWESLRHSEQLAIDLIRDGRPLTVTWLIR